MLTVDGAEVCVG